jgi:hypothetical protein
MKLNDIVEHAKGRRAKIYNRKPKNTIEPHKPQAPVGPMSEAEVTLKPLAGAQEVDVDGKAVGTATTPQAATAISDLAKKGEFTPATSDNQQPAAMEDEVGTPYFVKLTGNGPVVKSGNGFTPIVASKIWDTMTPEIEEKARTQGFRKITLSVNGAMIPALEGGGKVIVGKSSYGTIANSQNEEHNHHGVDAHGDVGGDATDSLLSQIKAEPEDTIGHGNMYEMYRIRQLAGLKEDDTTLAPQAQPTPDELDARLTPDQKAQQDKSVAAMTQATAGLDDKKDDVIGIGLAAALKTLPPEYQAAAKDVYVYNPDGTVDGDETMFKMAEMWANLGTQLYNLFATLVTKMEGYIRDQVPEFVALPPEQQQQIIKDVADMKAGLEKLKAEGEKAQAEWEKLKPDARKNIDQRANDRFSANNNGAQMVRGGAGQKTNIGMDPNNPGGPGAKGAFAGESADDKLLQKMLMIAGLR